MKKYFCDKCDGEIPKSEIPDDEDEKKGIILGIIELKSRERIRIGVYADLQGDRNICRNCAFDAIASMDFRPKKVELPSLTDGDEFFTDNDLPKEVIVSKPNGKKGRNP